MKPKETSTERVERLIAIGWRALPSCVCQNCRVLRWYKIITSGEIPKQHRARSSGALKL